MYHNKYSLENDFFFLLFCQRIPITTAASKPATISKPDEGEENSGTTT
jgi:hypothetical protein